jgi:hypothetical protein
VCVAGLLRFPTSDKQISLIVCKKLVDAVCAWLVVGFGVGQGKLIVCKKLVDVVCDWLVVVADVWQGKPIVCKKLDRCVRQSFVSPAPPTTKCIFLMVDSPSERERERRSISPPSLSKPQHTTTSPDTDRFDALPIAWLLSATTRERRRLGSHILLHCSLCQVRQRETPSIQSHPMQTHSFVLHVYLSVIHVHNFSPPSTPQASATT